MHRKAKKLPKDEWHRREGMGDFYEYYYTDDVEKKVYTISIYDSELMKVL